MLWPVIIALQLLFCLSAWLASRFFLQGLRSFCQQIPILVFFSSQAVKAPKDPRAW